MPAPKDPEKRKQWIENLRGPRPSILGEKNPQFGKDHSGKRNGMFGRTGDKNPMFGVDRSGEKNPNYGKKHPGLNTGENNPRFKGGVNESTGYHWTCSDKLIIAVRDRDNHTCQLCGEIWIEGGRKYDTHHIYGPDDNKNPCSMEKLITLCQPCHNKVNLNFADYIPQFEEIVNKSA